MTMATYEITMIEKAGGDLEICETRTRLESAQRLAAKLYPNAVLLCIDKRNRDGDLIEKFYFDFDTERWESMGN